MATRTPQPTQTATATRTPTRTPTVQPTPTLRPRCTVSPTTMRVGSNITISCTGFAAGERVNLSWDSTRNGTIAAFTAGSTGSGSTRVKVPETPGGSHTLIVKGATSRAQSNVRLTVKPSVALSPKSGNPGTRVTVTMRGFKANEVIDVRWYVTSSRTTTVKRQIVANARGSVTTTFTVPSTATAGGHKIEAVGRNGTKASYTFTVNATRSASVEEPTREPAAEPTAVPRQRPTRTPVPTETPAPTETPTAAPPQPDPPVSPESSG